MQVLENIAPGRLIVTDPPTAYSISKKLAEIETLLHKGKRITPIVVGRFGGFRYLILDGHNRAYIQAVRRIPIVAILLENDGDGDLLLKLEAHEDIESFPHRQFLLQQLSLKELLMEAQQYAGRYNFVSLLRLGAMDCREQDEIFPIEAATSSPRSLRWRQRYVVVYDGSSEHILPVKAEKASAARKSGYTLVSAADRKKIAASIVWAIEHARREDWLDFVDLNITSISQDKAIE